MNEMLELSLAAAENEIYVFPCCPKTKKPLITNWPDNASTDENQIGNWWGQWPTAMVGAITGHKSGFFVLDIDVKDGITAEQKLGQLQARHGEFEAEIMKVRTPSGGLHLYFRMPEHIDLRNSAGKLGQGIDIRANGGYVIFAGSIRADGKPYEIIREESANDE